MISRIPKKWKVCVEQRHANMIPDLILDDAEAKVAIIVDIKVPYDNHLSFTNNIEDMNAKYNPILNDYISKGYDATIQTIQVGCLGLVPSTTFSCLKSIGIKGRHTNLTARYLSQMIVHESRNCMVEHTTGVTQSY